MSAVYIMYNGATPFVGIVGDATQSIGEGFNSADGARIYAEDLAGDIAYDLAIQRNDPSLVIKPSPYVPNNDPGPIPPLQLFELEVIDPNVAGMQLIIRVPAMTNNERWVDGRSIVTNIGSNETVESIATAIMGADNATNDSSVVLESMLLQPQYTDGGKRLTLVLSVTGILVEFTLVVPTANLSRINTFGGDQLSQQDSDDYSTFTGALYQSTTRFSNDGNAYPFQFTATTDTSTLDLHIPAIHDLVSGDDLINYQRYATMKYGLGWKHDIVNALVDNSITLKKNNDGTYSSSPGTDRRRPNFFLPWENMTILNEPNAPSGSTPSFASNTLPSAYLQEFKFAQCGYHQFTVQPGKLLYFAATLSNDPGDGREIEIGSSRTTSRYTYDLTGNPFLVSGQLPHQIFDGSKYRMFNNTTNPLTFIVPVVYSKAPDLNLRYGIVWSKTDADNFSFDVLDLGVPTPGQVVGENIDGYPRIVKSYTDMGTITLGGETLTGGQKVAYLQLTIPTLRANMYFSVGFPFGQFPVGNAWTAKVWQVTDGASFPADYLCTEPMLVTMNNAFQLTAGNQYIVEIMSVNGQYPQTMINYLEP